MPMHSNSSNGPATLATMTTRVTELWDRPPVRWAFSMLAAAVLVVGAVLFWNARTSHDAASITSPPSHPFAKPNPAKAYGKPIAMPPQVKTLVRRFVEDGILRKNPAATWGMVSPRIQSGVTRQQWNAGTMPIPEFPTSEFAGAGYHALVQRARLIELSVTLANTKPAVNPNLDVLIQLRPIGGPVATHWVIVYVGERGGGPPIPAAQ